MLGLALLVLGIGAGAAMFLLSGSTREQTIEKFARAPVGCTTALQFDTTGTFTVYIELDGSTSSLDGDCGASGQPYAWTGATLPSYSLAMVDDQGQPVGLSDSTAYSYDTGTWRGQAVSQVQIATPGSYRLTVDSPDTGFAVAVGGDPNADAATMQMGGIGVAAAGVVVGLLLIVIGRRRGAPPSVPYAPVGAPVPYPTAPSPTTPPSALPYPAPPSVTGAPTPYPVQDRPRLATRPPEPGGPGSSNAPAQRP